jgi:hypothetical protein
MRNSTYTSTTLSAISIDYINDNIFTGQPNFDPVSVVFEYLFNTDNSLKDQNKFVFLFLQRQISNNKIDIVHNLFSEKSALSDLHPSLLKSMLIMSENIPALAQSRENVESIYSNKRGI